jgi:bromodomain-containing factor 1
MPQKNEEDIFYEGLRKVMSAVIGNRDSWVFRDPVDEVTVPNYRMKIKNPICLNQMRDKVEKREYKTLGELEQDFKLLVNNSESFNGPKSGFTAMAYGIWKHFRKSVQAKMNRTLEEADEEKVFLFPPPKKWKKSLSTSCNSGTSTNDSCMEFINGINRDHSASSLKSTLN